MVSDFTFKVLFLGYLVSVITNPHTKNLSDERLKVGLKKLKKGPRKLYFSRKTSFYRWAWSYARDEGRVCEKRHLKPVSLKLHIWGFLKYQKLTFGNQNSSGSTIEDLQVDFCVIPKCWFRHFINFQANQISSN